MRHFLAFLLLVSLDSVAGHSPASTQSGDLRLTVRKKISLPAESKFVFFVDGKRQEGRAEDLGKHEGGYCAFENTHLNPITLSPSTPLKARLEKLEFPNRDLVRYSLISSPTGEFSLFCDFTQTAKFDPQRVLKFVNRQLGSWARVSQRP